MANQSLFWSGTFQVVNIISMMNSAGVKLVSSTNAPASAIINNLGLDVSWCGIEGGKRKRYCCFYNGTHISYITTLYSYS